MRPAEVIHLRFEQCHLPETGWGMLNLSGGVVTAGIEVLFRHYAKFLDGVRERETSEMNWEFRRKCDPFLQGTSERRLAGESPAQAPLFVPLEEAELLRRVGHQQVLRVLVVHASHGR
ncbi:hypothetical protein [Streptomyces sp. NPDC056361]|uniref:hypothetical protein n=1 Tax=Streptomyces sp. NPDC056361 TaxID=3345795 RepID=UPI0035DDB804